MRRFLLILFVIILAGGAVWYFVIRPKQQAAPVSQGSGFRSFFSLGDTDTPPPAADTATDAPAAQPTTPAAVASPFTQLSAGPVAGFTSYPVTHTITIPATDPKKKPTQQVITDYIIRYVSRANGYVYEIKNNGTPTQITNIFIPNVYEASFADTNMTAVVRFLRDDNQTIATYSIPIPEPNPDGTRTQREGVYLPDNVRSLAVSPDQKLLARLTTDPNISAVTTSDTHGGSVKLAIQSPFHEWLVSWANQLYLQTKASASVNGFLYRIDSNKRLVRVLGDTPGLTASVSPKGTYVLYSQSSATGFSTKLLIAKNGNTKDLGVSILPENCEWLANEDAVCAGVDSVPQGTYPDDWYKGLMSFSDKLYHMYTSSGLLQTITSDPTPYDITAISYDAAQNRIYFIDKSTGLLWQYVL